MKVLVSFILGVLAVVVVGIGVAYSGLYNVAARVHGNPITAWFLSTTMYHSVGQHAMRGQAPDQFSDDQVRQGFHFYNETCVYCHGGPGKDPDDIGKGLNPEPPYLPDTVGRWTNDELFWIVSNGVRMTGMPSFAATHKEEEIRNVVGFLRQLPKMTPEQYSQMEK
jgi:mono/diheme cytochrome c family protein